MALWKRGTDTGPTFPLGVQWMASAVLPRSSLATTNWHGAARPLISLNRSTRGDRPRSSMPFGQAFITCTP